MALGASFGVLQQGQHEQVDGGQYVAREDQPGHWQVHQVDSDHSGELVRFEAASVKRANLSRRSPPRSAGVLGESCTLVPRRRERPVP